MSTTSTTSTTSQGRRQTIAWLNPSQIPLVRQIADGANLQIVGAGASTTAPGDPAGVGTHIARELGVTHMPDLPETLRSTDADLVFIADPGDFANSTDRDDAAALLSAQQRGLHVASLEPLPAAALDLVAGGWLTGTGTQRPIDAARFCPLWRHHHVFCDAADALDAFGPPAALAVESWRTRDQGSLGAALFDAMDLIAALIGEPLTIDAAHANANANANTNAHAHAAAPSPAAPPGESLRGLAGTLTANLRFPDGRIASLIASDDAGGWHRSATLIGAGGRLRLMDDHFTWLAPDGTILEPPPTPSTNPHTDPSASAARAIAEQLDQILDPSRPDPAPTDHAAVLALAHAALLSARTGRPESPATVRRMAGAT